jgi:catechol 2,3-dioxygenase-like lactoylglutathione lyase family enzyme
MTTKANQRLRLLGVELYVEDLPRARDFYGGVLGLPLEEEQPDRHAKFAPLAAFLCLERKGVENYPSQDKAVVFLEVGDLQGYVASVGADRFVRVELGASPRWAVLHDPDGYNVVLIEGANDRPA